MFAEKLAGSTNGVIDLLHVIPSVIYEDEWLRNTGEEIPGLKDELYPYLFNEAELQLKQFSRTYFSFQTKGSNYVKIDRKPSESIVEHAWKGNYSLIIMNAKGKDASGMFRGSTTEQVLRKSHVPVMSLDDRPDTASVKRILVPTDGSILSMAAIPAAFVLAGIFDSQIQLYYVKPSGSSLTSFFKRNAVDDHQIADNVFQTLDEYLSDITANSIQFDRDAKRHSGVLLDKNNRRTLHLEIGTGISVHQKIISYAEEEADLVVMTTHGRSGVAQIILGSVAEKVALNTDRSILTIRPDSKLFTNSKTADSPA